MSIYYFLLALTPVAVACGLVRARSFETVTLGFVTLVSVAVSALRWNSDIDYPEYAEMFAQNPTLSGFNSQAIAGLYGEPGYLFLTALFKSFGLSFIALAACCSVVAISLKAWVVSKFTKAASFALCLYLSVHFITIEFIQIRWAVASALIALAIYYQFRRKILLAMWCLAFATSIHYFSAIFILVILMAEIKSVRLFNMTVALVCVFGVLASVDSALSFTSIESDLYVVRRAFRYLVDPLSSVGLFSYLKLALIPVIVQYSLWRNPGLRRDASIEFVRRIAYSCVAITLAVSIVPLMHFRAVVLADVFLAVLLGKIMEAHAGKPEFMVTVVAVSMLYATWYVLDISNYVVAERLFPYQTWLP